jgi:hypothetical protein
MCKLLVTLEIDLTDPSVMVETRSRSDPKIGT